MPALPCVVAAPNYEVFRGWCRTHRINPATVTYVSGPEKLYGHGSCDVVFLDGYYRHSVFWESSDAKEILLGYASSVRRDWDIPLVESGRVVGWQ